jgi:hypothetical protein
VSDPHFYEYLPVFDEFASITDPRHYRPLPDDWHVVVADVEKSTAAIAKGLYKQVNIIGAASIAAVLDAVKPLKVPFVFGGDGATLCVPEPSLALVRQALLATKMMAQQQFNLALRVGIVPVRDIHEAGHRALVARYRVSRHYTQAVFTGGGISFAEACVKDVERGRRYRLEIGDVHPAASFDSIECRWEDIPSPHGETISLVVLAVSPDTAQRATTYREVLECIQRIYGDSHVSRPVRLDAMRLTRSNRKLSAEVGVRSFGHGRLYRARYWLRLKLQMAVGYWVFPRNLRFAGVDWGEYQREVVENTDCRKFDDLLRQVLSGTARQREELTGFLQQMHERGELVYGIHAAPSALMTCLLFNRQGEHVHFVDGADGGYAIAALQMKRQLRGVPGNE